MYDRSAIRDRRNSGASIRGIARDLGASRNAVRRALAPGANLSYRRRSLSNDFAPAVRDCLVDSPRMTVHDIAQAVQWPASERTLATLVARLRPLALAIEREPFTAPTVGRARMGTMRVGKVTTGGRHASTTRTDAAEA